MTDFAYFIDLCQQHLSTKRQIGDSRTMLLRKINILDQWYRTLNREYIENAQNEFDLVCQSLLDSELLATNLSAIDDARDIVYTVILHAKDCAWTERWILKYADDFKDDKFILRHLSHFLYRSDCRDSTQIKEAVEARIRQLNAGNE